MGTIDEVSFIRLDVVAVVSLLGFYLEKVLEFGFLLMLFFFLFFHSLFSGYNHAIVFR